MEIHETFHVKHEFLFVCLLSVICRKFVSNCKFLVLIYVLYFTHCGVQHDFKTNFVPNVLWKVTGIRHKLQVFKPDLIHYRVYFGYVVSLCACMLYMLFWNKRKNVVGSNLLLESQSFSLIIGSPTTIQLRMNNTKKICTNLLHLKKSHSEL